MKKDWKSNALFHLDQRFLLLFSSNVVRI